MATSSISADVKAANSKLAQYLRRIEEQEQGLQIGRRKPKRLDEEKLPGGEGRWRLEPDYHAPSPMVDRPRTLSGATSFHFSYSTFSKEVVPTVNGKPVAGAMGKPSNGAVEHAKYIERDGAAENVPSSEHAAYIERPGAVEIAHGEGAGQAGLNYSEALFSEAPTADEAMLLGSPAEVQGGVPSVFSNISSDQSEREEFWRAVERCEANPKLHSLLLRLDAPEVFWDNLEAATFVDPAFREHALSTREAYRQHKQRRPNPEHDQTFEQRLFRGSQERLGRIIQQIQSMPGYDDRVPPVRFESGRGGRIQFRLVAELPHELSAADRALIVQNFCDYLSSLEERRDHTGKLHKVGIMHTAVIHAPDSHNDSRNFHLHLIGYDRPARYLAEHSKWDFEHFEFYNHKGEDRLRYPYRQNKIGEVTQGSNKTGKATSGVDFIPSLRREFARITNKVLEARGIERRLDPRRYDQMGIDRTPTEHLGTKAAALESIGVATNVGKRNALAIWADAERSIQRQAVAAGKAHQAIQKQFGDVLLGATAANVTGPEASRFRALLLERERLIKDIADDRQSIMTFDHMEAKAKSRAVRTRKTCLQFLADIEAGRADSTTRKMGAAIVERWQSAQRHIESIDRDLAPHRPALARAADDIQKRETRLLEIDQALHPLRDLLEAKTAEAKRQPAQTKQAGKGSSGTTAQQANAASAASQDRPSTAVPEAPAPNPSAPSKAADARPAAAPSGPQPTVANVPSDPKLAFPEAAGPEQSDQAADLHPITMDGSPIAEPTIRPRQDIPRHTSQIHDGVPEGLIPLRPPELVEIAGDPAGGAIDIDPGEQVDAHPSSIEPGRTELPAAATHAGVDSVLSAPIRGDNADRDVAVPAGPDRETEADRTSSPSVQAGPNEVQSGQVQPPAPIAGVDPNSAARSNSANPAAGAPGGPINAPTPPATPEANQDRGQDQIGSDSQAPASSSKPVDKQASYAEFDALLNRIASDRIPIVAKTQAGKTAYSVPSLTDEERLLLRSPRFKARADKRLAGILTTQRNEIQRLVRWVKTQGKEPGNLTLADRKAILGRTVPKAVATLFKNWRTSDEVLTAIRAENDRRIAVAQEAARAKDARKKTPEPKAPEKQWPDPSAAQTDHVKKFLKLLSEGAAPHILAKAAFDIQDSAAARVDIMRYGPEVATAYELHRPKQPGAGQTANRGRGIGD